MGALALLLMARAKPDRQILLDVETRRRLGLACQVLGCTLEEFIGFAVREALDELDGYARDEAVRRAYYESVNRQTPKAAAERRRLLLEARERDG